MTPGHLIIPPRRKPIRGVQTIEQTMADDEKKKAEFRQGIEACLDSLYGTARRLTRNDADAEDLVAESISKAWTAFDRLNDRQRFRPWLFRILHNQFISSHRKRSVRPKEQVYDELAANDEAGDLTALLIQQSDDFLHWWGNPERAFANSLLGEHILSAIEHLPDTFRTTVLLVNVEGLSYDEAAEALGVPLGTVHSRVKRGRTLLQKALWEQARDANLIPGGEMKGCAL